MSNPTYLVPLKPFSAARRIVFDDEGNDINDPKRLRIDARAHMTTSAPTTTTYTFTTRVTHIDLTIYEIPETLIDDVKDVLEAIERKITPYHVLFTSLIGKTREHLKTLLHSGNPKSEILAELGAALFFFTRNTANSLCMKTPYLKSRVTEILDHMSHLKRISGERRDSNTLHYLLTEFVHQMILDDGSICPATLYATKYLLHYGLIAKPLSHASELLDLLENLANNSSIANFYTKFQTNVSIQTIHPSFTNWTRALLRLTPEDELTHVHVFRGLLLSLISCHRQVDLGNCFAVAPLIVMQATQPIAFLKLMETVLTKGTFLCRGKQVPFPYERLDEIMGNSPLLHQKDHSRQVPDAVMVHEAARVAGAVSLSPLSKLPHNSSLSSAIKAFPFSSPQRRLATQTISCFVKNPFTISALIVFEILAGNQGPSSRHNKFIPLIKQLILAQLPHCTRKAEADLEAFLNNIYVMNSMESVCQDGESFFLISNNGRQTPLHAKPSQSFIQFIYESHLLYLLSADNSWTPLLSISDFSNALCQHVPSLNIQPEDLRIQMSHLFATEAKQVLNLDIPQEYFLSADLSRFPFTGAFPDSIIETFQLARYELSKSNLPFQEILRLLSCVLTHISNLKDPIILTTNEHVFTAIPTLFNLPEPHRFNHWFKERFDTRVKAFRKRILSKHEAESLLCHHIEDSSSLGISPEGIHFRDFLKLIEEHNPFYDRNILILDLLKCYTPTIDLQGFLIHLRLDPEIAQHIQPDLFNTHEFPFKLAEKLSSEIATHANIYADPHIIHNKLFDYFDHLLPWVYLGDSNWGRETDKQRKHYYFVPDLKSRTYDLTLVLSGEEESAKIVKNPKTVLKFIGISFK